MLKNRFSSFTGRHDGALTLSLTNLNSNLAAGWTMRSVGWMAMQIMGWNLLTRGVKSKEEAEKALEMLNSITLTPVNARQVVLTCRHPLGLKYFDGWDGYPRTLFFALPSEEMLVLEEIVLTTKPPKKIRFAPTDPAPAKADADFSDEKDPPEVILDGGDGDNDEDDLPEVPLGPPGIDLDANVALAHDHFLNLWWFYEQVHNGGVWDFKLYHKLGNYADFGNFHYGVVGKALGVPEWLLLVAAGFYQEFFGTQRKDGVIVSTYKPEFGHAWTGAPFGDDPDDQKQIKRGFEYYDKKYGNLPEEPFMGP